MRRRVSSGLRLSRRAALRRLTGAAVGLSFVSIVGLSSACQLVSKKTSKLTFFSDETTQSEIDYMVKVNEEYKQKNGVEVEMIYAPGDQQNEKAMSAVSAGHPFDLIATGNFGLVLDLAANDQLVPVTSIVDKVGGKDDFGPEILFPYKGEIWWYPFDYNFSYIYYRTDVFQQKGLEPPKTWDQWLSAAKTLTTGDTYGTFVPMSEAAGNCNGGAIFYGNDVVLYDKDSNVILDSPEIKPKVVEALNFYKELNKYMPPGMESATVADDLNAFATGRAMMVPYAGRLVHYIMDKAPELLDKFAILPTGYPTKTGARPTVTNGPDGICLSKGANVDAARDYLTWFCQEKMIGFELTIPIHLFPPRKSIFSNPQWKENETVRRFWTQAVQPQIDFLNGANIAMVSAQNGVVNPGTAAIENAYVIPHMMQEVVLKNLPPEQAVDTAAKQMRDIMAKVKK